MVKEKMFAVLTGDLIGSSRFNIEKQRDEVLSILKDSFNKIESPEITASHFAIHRGDSFQGVLSRPEEALKAAIIIRASLLSKPLEKIRLDARIAIGMGKIDYFPVDQVGEGDGEAFRYSGMELDKMKKGERNLTIKTPWPEMNEELQTECALLNALIYRWTKEQAEAIMYQIQGYKQEEIAEKLEISQSAVFQRQRNGGAWAVQAFLERFKVMVKYKVVDL
ncbi:MAG TPA: SatD family protein [archaeon]|nr:SatD family protein [archaeon]